MFYFWKKDIENGYYTKNESYYRDQAFQEIIYGLNQPYLRVNQSAFTNVTIMDRPYLTEIFGGKKFPDGSYMIDYIEDLIQFEKDFMRVVEEVRRKTVFTFPVLTFSLLYRDGKFVDEEFARWANHHNMEFADSNFFVSEDVTSLSSCCFDGSQMCLTKDSNGVHYMTFKELYNAPYNESKRNFTIFHNGSWVKGKIVKLPKRDMYRVTTTNKKEILVTDNHICPTDSGDKRVMDLTTDDYLLFNSRSLDTFPEKDVGLTYDEGFLIGMYLGDGSIAQHKDTFTPVVNLSLNRTKWELSREHILRAVSKIGSVEKIGVGKEYNNVVPVTIRDKDVSNFIKTYVHGSYAQEKELDMNVLLQSKEFRSGIVDGYYLTDGGNSNRIYTTSEKLAYQIETLFTSLGINTVIDVTDRRDEPVVIRGETYARNYKLYCIRWYDPQNKRTMGDSWKVVNNCEYFRVSSIEKIETEDDYVYCFEMENENEPYFTLPNGVITHNCRLVNDFTKLNGFVNSIGGTALKIGSVKVNTINLARIAFEAKGSKTAYIDILKDRADICMKTLDVIRNIIKRNIEKGILPNYTYGLIELKNQYNTIGINGMYEAVELMGGIREDEFGNKYYTDDGLEFAVEVMDTLNKCKDEFPKDYSINIEAVPAERCASVNYRKDKLLYPNAPERTLYGNQWIPLDQKCTLNEKIRLGAILDKKCGGGQ